jgi:glycosyltransferase involved in cell wall biosynthesis
MRDSGADLLFDVRHVEQSGIGTYIRTHLPVLEKSMNDRNLVLAVLADKATLPAVQQNTRVILADPANAPMYSLAEQRTWAKALRTVRPRAVWLPHYPYALALLGPRYRHVETFITVHDAIHLLEPAISDQSLPRRMYARTMLTLDALRCTRIFTPSQATADEVIDITPRAKVTVTPIPVDEVWFSPVDTTLSPAKPPYVLYVGNVKRHKNIGVLLDAFAAIAGDIPHTLVVAGGGASLRTQDRDVDRRVDALGERVQLTGRLEFDALRALVAGADLLIMPSLHEGAGLPPLEAMASRTAVLASAIPALRETCGDGAAYFDPRNHLELAGLIEKFCRDDDAREALAERGYAHVVKRQSEIVPTTTADVICTALEDNR